MNDPRLDQIAALADDARCLAFDIRDETCDDHDRFMLAALRDDLNGAIRVVHNLKKAT